MAWDDAIARTNFKRHVERHAVYGAFGSDAQELETDDGGAPYGLITTRQLL